jgi:excisionase family DNA binding protein
MEPRTDQISRTRLSDAGEREWLSVAEVADHLQVNEETVRRWVRSGALPVLNLGGRRAGYRIRRAELARFIEARHGPLRPAGAE